MMHIYFSRGYRIDLRGSRYGDGVIADAVLESGDATTNELYRALVTGTIVATDWDTVRPVLDHAIIMFGDLKTWFRDQLIYNSKVCGHRLEYLVDTMGYLLTGKRALSPESWINLIMLQEDGPRDKAAVVSKAMPMLNAIDKYSPQELLQLWLSRKDGFTDLIDAMRIFFGAHVQRDLREPVQ